MMTHLNQVYATDKDIFDLLTSAKRKITESVLREIARKRGIFFSPLDTRDDIIEAISLLPFTLNEIVDLVDRRETARRNEKSTYITLNADLTINDIKNVMQEYKTEVGFAENVSFHNHGADELVLNVGYDEIDYSRTRLLQRQHLEANIEVSRAEGKIKVRFPASEKSLSIVNNLKSKMEKNCLSPIASEAIELDEEFTAEDRTMFFLRLIKGLPGYRLSGVTNLKIASTAAMVDDELTSDIDEELVEEESQMLSLVKSMALNGENLLASPEYQTLRERGFFITSITWKVMQDKSPYDMLHIHAEFEDGECGKGFKYMHKGAYRRVSDYYRKTLRPVNEEEKKGLYDLIESAARCIINEMKCDNAAKLNAQSEALL